MCAATLPTPQADLRQQCGPRHNRAAASTNSSKLKLAVGAAALLLTAWTILSILLPHTMTLLAAWCVVEAMFWVFVFRPAAQELDAQRVERPQLTDQDIDRAWSRFIQVSFSSVERGRYRPRLASSGLMQALQPGCALLQASTN